MTWGVKGVKGYPTGAPQDACGAMLPYHGPQGDDQLYPSQTGPAPYTIQVASHHGTYLPGKAMNVTLIGNVAFKGFLLQARVTKGNTQVGTWSIPSAISAHARHVACGCHDGAVTHRNNTDKRALTFMWNAPPVGTGDVKFV
ncbi:putative defense protein 3 [Lingula anatina]|uniref:Defense protein 3 n=1 Tax=Lingula anatina TaxID=7574 RepID=A0A1S3II91_LINAN|nr:putative defense protein 3 [Lingula anatina]|eukprot:XP_013397596.1 putative defense protein 3 [Lingula anatina]